MFDLSSILTKPLIIIIIGLSLICMALSGYSWYQVSQKNRLAKELAVTEMQLINLSKQAKIERNLYAKTLTALQQREIETRYVVTENNELRSKLKEIVRNEKDVCLNTNLPKSIIGLLTVPKDS